MKYENKDLQIIDYTPQYLSVFKNLNAEWIQTWFKMEESDYKTLDHPQEYILDAGGYIFVALYKNEPVGVCALIKVDNDKYEMAKMAVAPKSKGLGIGYNLGLACIEKCKSINAKKLILQSNTILEPAINLYNKLGFKKIIGAQSPYERCNIQMELNIDNQV